MLRTKIIPYTLQFTFEAGTSRGVLREKVSYFIRLESPDGTVGYGECGPLKDLSIDDLPNLPARLEEMLQPLANCPVPRNLLEVNSLVHSLVPESLPAVRFALETALLDVLYGGRRQILPNSWAPFSPQKGMPLPINGLIWMGSEAFMQEQITRKLKTGFSCIKMKIGAIDFETEFNLLKKIRQQFSADAVTLRVDANGAFRPEEALEKLKRLADLDLHSIEQPIAAGQWEHMYRLCRESPLPIALDEELIGVYNVQQENLLRSIQPQYIILKPSLLGGLQASANWIAKAEQHNTGWWITSALESNIGLNAISQFTATYGVTMPQGLGTGQLYHNNIPSPLTVASGYIHYDPETPWAIASTLA